MSEERFAEGQREESTCRRCGQPVWIVYHGPMRNHTLEPRSTSPLDEWLKTHAAVEVIERVVLDAQLERNTPSPYDIRDALLKAWAEHRKESG